MVLTALTNLVHKFSVSKDSSLDKCYELLVKWFNWNKLKTCLSGKISWSFELQVTEKLSQNLWFEGKQKRVRVLKISFQTCFTKSAIKYKKNVTKKGSDKSRVFSFASPAQLSRWPCLDFSSRLSPPTFVLLIVIDDCRPPALSYHEVQSNYGEQKDEIVEDYWTSRKLSKVQIPLKARVKLHENLWWFLPPCRCRA
jgi:hypothetical protein